MPPNCQTRFSHRFSWTQVASLWQTCHGLTSITLEESQHQQTTPLWKKLQLDSSAHRDSRLAPRHHLHRRRGRRALVLLQDPLHRRARAHDRLLLARSQQAVGRQTDRLLQGIAVRRARIAACASRPLPTPTRQLLLQLVALAHDAVHVLQERLQRGLLADRQASPAPRRGAAPAAGAARANR